MAVDERARHELLGRLDDVLGREEATTLMSLLPPVGWADVATKHDLDSLGIQLRSELRAEIGQLRGEFHRDLGALTRTLMISMLTTVIAAGLAFGAARLI
ncbi:MAG: hypothetical protein ACRD0W_14400 [Acidimicrobiales bacterium]